MLLISRLRRKAFRLFFSTSIRYCRRSPKGIGSDIIVDETYIPNKRYISKIDSKKVEDVADFDEELINHLERLSLVRFTNEEAVSHLRAAIKYANQLKLLDTKGVEPLESVLEGVECPLREDVPMNTPTKKEILMNSRVICEDYFVTPPGNIPLDDERKLDLRKVNEWDKITMKDESV